MNFITEEQFKQVLPAQMRKNVNKDVLDIINSAVGDIEDIRCFRENLVTYQSVLTQGKFQLPKYVEAVKYVTHKLLGCNNITAYTRAFPEKIADFKSRGVSEADIHRYVSAYNAGKVVTAILAQSMIPVHIMNADIYQEAVNIQIQLARTAQSEKVRSDAANSLMVQLRPPETKKVELDIGLKEDSALTALKEATSELIAQQRTALQAGIINAQDAARSGIVIEGIVDES